MSQKERKIKLTVRLTAQEHNHLKKQSALCGLKMEPYVKRLIMGKEVHPLPPDSYRQLAKELSAIGKNVNQIARIANSTRSVTLEPLHEIRDQLERLWDVYDGDH